MMRATILLLAMTLAVPGCSTISESRLNPFNWLPSAEEQPQGLVPVTTVAEDPRPLVAEVVELRLERTPDGVLLTATGRAATQGYWAAELVAVDSAQGVLAFAFRAAPPASGAPVSTERSREIVVARFLSTQDLAGIREIRVGGALSSRAVRR